MEFKDYAYLITALIGLLTFIKALREYIINGRQKKIELLNKYRDKFQNEQFFTEINPLIENDSKDLQKISRLKRYYYLGFFEEISILMNSRVLKAEIIHYFFGYYSILTKKSSNFWFDINRDSFYWKEFNNFVEKMKKIENKKETNINKRIKV